MWQVVPLCILPLLAGVARAQVRPAAPDAAREFAPGKVLPVVSCVGNPQQSYALYLPSGYSQERRWPIVYVLDPAARGQVPLEHMKSAAEHYGFLLAASNNSKNGPWKPQAEAADATWQDTHDRLSVDDRRTYFAGFSGGARAASHLAEACRCAQGVFLSGAGFSRDAPPSAEAPFAVFATMGMTDFNYAELVELDEKLNSLGQAHFLRRFEGPHQWAPPEVWEEAFAWMELLAMKEQRRPRDAAFVSRELALASERARNLQDSGQLYFAWEDFRQMARTFDGLADTATLKERAATLETNPAVRAGRKNESKEIEEQYRRQHEVLAGMNALGQRRPVQNQESFDDDLPGKVRSAVLRLREDALHERKPDRQRVLQRAHAGVFAAFIETGESVMAAGNLSLARTYLELAVVARPDWPWPHLALAECLAKQRDKKGALRSLKLACDAGLTPERLVEVAKQTPELAALIAEPEFQKLLGKAPQSAGAPQKP